VAVARALRDTGRVKRLAALVLVVGCGSEPVVPDLFRCVQLAEPVAFQTDHDFAPAEPGTLAGWDPNGRWFMIGPKFGPSSVHIARSGNTVTLDRNPAFTGTIDDSELFGRLEYTNTTGSSVIVATRISNLHDDGRARVERGTCTDGKCTLCTGELVRATYHFESERVSLGISLIGQLNDPQWPKTFTFNVRVAGTMAYLIRRDGLRIIDVSDLSHPVELGSYHRGGEGYPNDVKVVTAGARTYVVIADTPVDIVDVTDPRAPQLAAQIPLAAHTVFTETRAGATWAYFGGLDGTCPVYDVTDPALPKLLGSYAAMSALVHDLSVKNGIAYLNAWDGGFQIVDFTDPAMPRRLGTWAPTPVHTSHSNWTTVIGGRRIALHGEEGYDAKLHVVDVDPASPQFLRPIGTWATRPWVSIHNIMAFGAKAYMTYYQDGVRVLDVSNPLAPVEIGFYNTWDPQADYTSSAFYEGAVGLDVDPETRTIFVADSPRGLLILHDQTPDPR
jgi:hypothetical protein